MFWTIKGMTPNCFGHSLQGHYHIGLQIMFTVHTFGWACNSLLTSVVKASLRLSMLNQPKNSPLWNDNWFLTGLLFLQSRFWQRWGGYSGAEHPLSFSSPAGSFRRTGANFVYAIWKMANWFGKFNNTDYLKRQNLSFSSGSGFRAHQSCQEEIAALPTSWCLHGGGVVCSGASHTLMSGRVGLDYPFCLAFGRCYIRTGLGFGSL